MTDGPPGIDPGVVRLILADCDRIDADHQRSADGHCTMCGQVWRRPVEWPCTAVRTAAQLRTLCARRAAPPA